MLQDNICRNAHAAPSPLVLFTFRGAYALNHSGTFEKFANALKALDTG